MKWSVIDPAKIQTVSDVAKVARMDECNYFTSRRSFYINNNTRDSFRLHLDFIRNDLPHERLCIDVEFYAQSTIIYIEGHCGYDADQSRYTGKLFSGSRSIENRRGRTPLSKFRDELWDTMSSYATQVHDRPEYSDTKSAASSEQLQKRFDRFQLTTIDLASRHKHANYRREGGSILTAR